MAHAGFRGRMYEPTQALKMARAYNAAYAELEAAGDLFNPEALATIILALEKTAPMDTAKFAQRAVKCVREGAKRAA